MWVGQRGEGVVGRRVALFLYVIGGLDTGSEGYVLRGGPREGYYARQRRAGATVRARQRCTGAESEEGGGLRRDDRRAWPGG